MSIRTKPLLSSSSKKEAALQSPEIFIEKSHHYFPLDVFVLSLKKNHTLLLSISITHATEGVERRF